MKDLESLIIAQAFKKIKPGFQIVVPVARIVSVASNLWERQGRSYGNALAISSILATETRFCQTIEATEALGHIPWSTWLFTSRPYARFKVAAINSNNTSTLIEEIQRYECLYNKLSKDYKNRRTKENGWETIGQKFGLTTEAVPKTDSFFDVLSSSSLQNITENQITSQKSSVFLDWLPPF